MEYLEPNDIEHFFYTDNRRVEKFTIFNGSILLPNGEEVCNVQKLALDGYFDIYIIDAPKLITEDDVWNVAHKLNLISRIVYCLTCLAAGEAKNEGYEQCKSEIRSFLGVKDKYDESH